MDKLVKLRRNDAVTDSITIADGTGNQHRSVIRILQKYEEDFKSLGRLEFTDLKSVNPQGGRPVRMCYLNEPQATLLITYLDNTPVVRAFKLELVKQFYAMRKIIAERGMPEWKEIRRHTISTHKAAADVQKELAAYAAKQGSKHPTQLYQSYAKLANNLSGVENRETATLEQLAALRFMENAIAQLIHEGMSQGKHYKSIYQDCKKQLGRLV